MYEIAVRMHGFEWFVERSWKQIVALRAALEAAADAEAREREEGGAGHTNVILPALPRGERSVGTALSLMARAQTAQTRAVADDLSTFFKLLLLAIKGTPLLALVTDWLEAPAHLELKDQGDAGPLQRGAAGRFRILRRLAPPAQGAAAPVVSPLGVAWGVALREEGGGWVAEKEDEVVGRLQALHVSLGRVRDSDPAAGGGGGGGGGGGVPGHVWFELTVSRDRKRAAVRPAPHRFRVKV